MALNGPINGPNLGFPTHHAPWLVAWRPRARQLWPLLCRPGSLPGSGLQIRRQTWEKRRACWVSNTKYISYIYIYSFTVNLIHKNTSKYCWSLCLFTSQVSVFNWVIGIGDINSQGLVGWATQMPKKVRQFFVIWSGQTAIHFHHWENQCHFTMSWWIANFVFLISQPCEEGACFHQRFSLQEMSPKKKLLGKSVESQHLQKCRKKPTGVSWELVVAFWEANIALKLDPFQDVWRCILVGGFNPSEKILVKIGIFPK